MMEIMLVSKFHCDLVCLSLQSLIAEKRDVGHMGHFFGPWLSRTTFLATSSMFSVISPIPNVVLYLPVNVPLAFMNPSTYHTHCSHSSPRIPLYLSHPPSNGRRFQIDRMGSRTRGRPPTSHIRRIDPRRLTSLSQTWLRKGRHDDNRSAPMGPRSRTRAYNLNQTGPETFHCARRDSHHPRPHKRRLHRLRFHRKSRFYPRTHLSSPST